LFVSSLTPFSNVEAPRGEIMDKKPKSTGWWQTLPGILTATAAILTAAGGLIVAFHQAGFFDRTSQTTPQTVTESPSATPTIPSTRKSMPNTSTAPYPVILPADTEVRVGDAVYKILTAQLDRYAPGKLSLRFEVRMVNNGRFPANFWGASFRLLVDGVPKAPDNSLNELVDSNSAKEGVVEFVIPDTVKSVGLQVGDVGEGKLALPILLKSAKQ
jgi:hypothetical protein